MSNKFIAAVLNVAGWFVLIAGIIGAFVATSLSQFSGVTSIIAFIAIVCGALVSSCILIALSRIVAILAAMTNDL